MKRLIIVLFIFLSTSIFAQKIELKAFRFDYVTATEEISSKSDVSITLNLDNKRCIIYSKKIQIIDFEVECIREDSEAAYVECSATDSNYNNIKFYVVMSKKKNLVLITIQYADAGYIYSCVPVY